MCCRKLNAAAESRVGADCTSPSYMFPRRKIRQQFLRQQSNCGLNPLHECPKQTGVCLSVGKLLWLCICIDACFRWQL